MKVYEVEADFDCTTRSTPSSYGLFSTREKAEAKLASLKLAKWQWGVVSEREVK